MSPFKQGVRIFLPQRTQRAQRKNLGFKDLSAFAAILAASILYYPISVISESSNSLLKNSRLVSKMVISAKAGIQKHLKTLDSRLHGNDEKKFQRHFFNSLLRRCKASKPKKYPLVIEESLFFEHFKRFCPTVVDIFKQGVRIFFTAEDAEGAEKK